MIIAVTAMVMVLLFLILAVTAMGMVLLFLSDNCCDSDDHRLRFIKTCAVHCVNCAGCGFASIRHFRTCVSINNVC